MVELGAKGVTLAAVQFYPRALTRSEIGKIFEGGQTVSELATGSRSRKLTENDFDRNAYEGGKTSMKLTRKWIMGKSRLWLKIST